MKDGKFIISILVSNHYGVLTRITGLFSRRGFNIDSLTVGETENPEYSRITITADGDNYTEDQIIKQLGKLHDVKYIDRMDENNTVIRELMLVKVKASPGTRGELVEAVNVFRGKVVDFTPESVGIEITGEQSKLDAFIEFVKPYGILELCRTGATALARGGNCLINDKNNKGEF